MTARTRLLYRLRSDDGRACLALGRRRDMNPWAAWRSRDRPGTSRGEEYRHREECAPLETEGPMSAALACRRVTEQSRGRALVLPARNRNRWTTSPRVVVRSLLRRPNVRPRTRWAQRATGCSRPFMCQAMNRGPRQAPPCLRCGTAPTKKRVAHRRLRVPRKAEPTTSP